MRCSKFKGERGDASRSKRHCYLSISKDPPLTKAEQKIKAQNRTYVYVGFGLNLPFFSYGPLRSGLFLRLFFVNSVQMDPGTRSPRPPRRVKPETPAIR
mgnify:CR=1 FL=1